MLSKLALRVSRGQETPRRRSQARGGLPRRWRTRRDFSRWKVRNPGLGFCAHDSSTRASSSSARAWRVSPAGPRESLRRHHPGAQLADHPFRGFRHVRGRLHLEGLERHVARHEGIVVADLAIHADDARKRLGVVQGAHLHARGGRRDRRAGRADGSGSAGRSASIRSNPSVVSAAGKEFMLASRCCSRERGVSRAQTAIRLPRILPQLQRTIRIAFALGTR